MTCPECGMRCDFDGIEDLYYCSDPECGWEERSQSDYGYEEDYDDSY